MSTPNPAATMQWIGDTNGYLRLLDQTRLPSQLDYLDCRTAEDVWDAIKRLSVRGAPAIGIAAAYGACLAAAALEPAEAKTRLQALQKKLDYLASSRPTAVNLFWALDRMRRCAEQIPGSADQAEFCVKLLEEARRIHEEDRSICHAIGRHGAALLSNGAGVLTHCNAGGLATSEHGTALAALFTAHDQGKQLHVFVDETRPLLQGARLTAWELVQYGINATLICDSMAAQVMKEGRAQVVIVGADRIAANGDTANKIGTYGLALLAHAHNIPFYVAAPVSTFDLGLASGDGIPIEQRAAEEITRGFGRTTAPEGVAVYNPAFDVTPAKYIHAIITELGIIQPVNTTEVARMVTANQGSSTGSSTSSTKEN